jgi:hypothetical protein
MVPLRRGKWYRLEAKWTIIVESIKPSDSLGYTLICQMVNMPSDIPIAIGNGGYPLELKNASIQEKAIDHMPLI